MTDGSDQLATGLVQLELFQHTGDNHLCIANRAGKTRLLLHSVLTFTDTFWLCNGVL